MPDHIWKNHAIRVKYIEGMWLSLMSRENLTLVIVVTYTASTHKCACFRISSWPFPEQVLPDLSPEGEASQKEFRV